MLLCYETFGYILNYLQLLEILVVQRKKERKNIKCKILYFFNILNGTGPLFFITNIFLQERKKECTWDVWFWIFSRKKKEEKLEVHSYI